jgi:hypothetical protein
MTGTDDAALAVLRDRLARARDSLGELPPGPPAAAVFRRARRRRAGRRLAAAGASVAAACLAVTVAYSGQGQPPPVPRTHLPVAVHARLAASWSVDTNANGTVTFRLRDTSDPARLEQVLTQAGVPALVRWGEICLARGRHVLLPTLGILTGPGKHLPGEQQLESVFLAEGGPKVLDFTWTINPANIPAGAHFVISAVPAAAAAPGHIRVAWEFVPVSAPVNCTATPPPLDG